MDVIALARHGIDYAVATLGTATTEEHLNKLLRVTDEVIFCFDGDRAGRDAAWKALETALPQLRAGRQIRFVFLPDGQDPDSFVQAKGASEFEQALGRGMALSEFFIGELAAQVDLESLDGRARLAELAKPLLHRIPAGVYKELLLGELAETVGLSASKLEAILSQDQPKPGNAPASNTATSSARGYRPQANKPSVVRRALTLLLHHPSAAGDLNIGHLEGLQRPGIDLLRQLIETVQSEPTLTTAGLLERWRDHNDGRHLGKLLATEIPDSEDFDPATELADCLTQLAAAGARERIEFLIDKERLNSLSEEERGELRRLSRRPATGK